MDRETLEEIYRAFKDSGIIPKTMTYEEGRLMPAIDAMICRGILTRRDIAKAKKMRGALDAVLHISMHGPPSTEE